MQTNIDYAALGSRIRAARDQTGITQAQLAEACSLSTSHIGHIERGSRILSVEVLFKIATILHVSLDYLLFDSAPTNDTLLTNIAEILKTKDQRKVKTFMTTVRALTDKIDDL